MPIRHATMSPGVRSGNPTALGSTARGRIPPRSRAAVVPSTVPQAAMADLRASYHAGRLQPSSDSAVSTAALAGWSSSAA